MKRPRAVASKVEDASQNLLPAQRWLMGRIDGMGMRKADLARAIGIGRVSVSRWFFPLDHPDYCRPSYESCRQIADAIGEPFDEVLTVFGYSRRQEDEFTPIQREVRDIVTLIPDDLLAPIVAQLKMLIDPQVQSSVRARVAEAYANARHQDDTASFVTTGTLPAPRSSTRD